MSVDNAEPIVQKNQLNIEVHTRRNCDHTPFNKGKNEIMQKIMVAMQEAKIIGVGSSKTYKSTISNKNRQQKYRFSISSEYLRRIEVLLL